MREDEIMALVKCPECGKEISDKADSCPNCGYLMNSSGDHRSCNIYHEADCSKIVKPWNDVLQSYIMCYLLIP